MVVDIIVGIILISGCVLGWRAGFFREVASKAGYIVGVIISFLFTIRLTQFLYVRTPVSVNIFVMTFLVYLLLFMAGLFVMKGIGCAVSGLFESIGLKVVDNILGMLLGLVEFIVIVSLILYAFQIQTYIPLSQYINSSYIYNIVVKRTLDILSVIWKWFENLI